MSLDDFSYKRVGGLTVQIVVAAPAQRRRIAAYDDEVRPEDIRAGRVSAKSVKQALGQALPQRRIQFLKPGIKLLDNSAWSPGVKWFACHALACVSAPNEMSADPNQPKPANGAAPGSAALLAQHLKATAELLERWRAIT